MVILQDDKPLRYYIDGVFDLWHPGHANLLRQCSELGGLVVVGINSDNDVKLAKGMEPIYTTEERGEIAKACRWVDEVIIGTPYRVELKSLSLFNCDWAVHGTDTAIDALGVNALQELVDANKLMTLPRTNGISTSNIIERIYNLYMNHTQGCEEFSNRMIIKTIHRYVPVATSNLFSIFNHGRAPTKNDIVVYLCGSFDFFNVLHIRYLKEAKSMGSYLIVGLFNDEDSAKINGTEYTVLRLPERAMNLMSMRYVDNIIMGAPTIITKELIETYKVNVCAAIRIPNWMEMDEAFAYPKGLGITRELSVPDNSIEMIFSRINERRSDIMTSLSRRLLG